MLWGTCCVKEVSEKKISWGGRTVADAEISGIDRTPGSARSGTAGVFISQGQSWPQHECLAEVWMAPVIEQRVGANACAGPARATHRPRINTPIFKETDLSVFMPRVYHI